MDNHFYLSIKNSHRKIEDVRNLFKNLTTREKEILEEEKLKSEKAKMEKDLLRMYLNNNDTSRKKETATSIEETSEERKENRIFIQKSEKFDFGFYKQKENRTGILNTNKLVNACNNIEVFDEKYDNDDFVYNSSSSNTKIPNVNYKPMFEFNVPAQGGINHSNRTPKNHQDANAGGGEYVNVNNNNKFTNIIFNNERKNKFVDYIRKYNTPVLFKENEKKKKQRIEKNANNGSSYLMTSINNLLEYSKSHHQTSDPSSNDNLHHHHHHNHHHHHHQNHNHHNNLRFIPSKVLAKKNVATLLDYTKISQLYNIN